MSAVLSFLGGSLFRMLAGQVMEWWNKAQEQKHEIERMREQEKIDAAQHARNLEAIRLQADLGVQTIRVQGEQRVAEIETQGWAAAVATATKPTGIYIVDLANGLIRPAAACIALYLWVVALNAAGWHMTDWDKELVGVILGFYFASRVMTQGRRPA